MVHEAQLIAESERQSRLFYILLGVHVALYLLTYGTVLVLAYRARHSFKLIRAYPWPVKWKLVLLSERAWSHLVEAEHLPVLRQHHTYSLSVLAIVMIGNVAIFAARDQLERVLHTVQEISQQAASETGAPPNQH